MQLRAVKVARDLFFARGRVAIMIVALAAGVTAIGTVTGARAIVQREMRLSYLGTHPASATLAIPGGAREDALRAARPRPDVLDAALRARAGARMTLPNGRRAPLLLFIAPARDPMTVAGFTLERGHWPPADDEMLLERSSLQTFGLRPNDRVDIETPDGGRATVRVAGAVHDGAVSPSSQEGAAYGYATPALLARLGRTPVLDLLKIVVGDGGQPSARRAQIEAVAEDVGMTLRARGAVVTRIDVPPPLRHPHQSQMETATSLLMTFAVVALVLAAILTAAMLGTMLAQHARQIGVMKTLGAGDSALFGMYLAMTLAIALAATLLALVPAALAARYLATIVAGLFGIAVGSLDVPWQVAATQIVAGIVLPVAVAWTTLARSTSVTVREAIDGAQHGRAAFGTTRLEAWLARRSTRSRTLRLALRNVARRPGRLVLVVALLGASGAVFVSASAAAAGMRAVVEDGMAHRHYDVEARLSRPENAAHVADALRGMPEVEAVDASISAAVTSPHDGPIEMTRAYPDGGHGSFAITAVQPATTFLRLPVTRGRWLRETDADGVVLNEVALAQQMPDARVGHDVELSVNGRVSQFKLLGVVSDFGSPATAYVTPAGFTRAAGEAGRVTLLRIATRRHDAAGRAAAGEAIRARLAGAGIALRAIAPITQFKIALDGHAQALAQTLSAVAVLMALVGILALGSAIGTGVMERTREIGILRSVGASAALIGRIVMTEGLLYGALSWLAALALAVPITLFLDRFVGTQAFLVPLPFVLPPDVVAISGAVALAGAAAASLAGAWTASRVTVRAALAAT